MLMKHQLIQRKEKLNFTKAHGAQGMMDHTTNLTKKSQAIFAQIKNLILTIGKIEVSLKWMKIEKNKCSTTGVTPDVLIVIVQKSQETTILHLDITSISKSTGNAKLRTNAQIMSFQRNISRQAGSLL